MGKRFGAGLAVMTLLLVGATRARAEYIVTSLPFGYAFNDSGQVIGSVQTSSVYLDSGRQENIYQAAMYNEGKVTTLAPEGGNYSGSSEAYGINNKGQVVGIIGDSPILFSNGKMTNLGTSGLGGSLGIGNLAINDKGQVVAGTWNSANQGIYLYSSGKWMPLVNDGVNGISSLRINASGQISGTGIDILKTNETGTIAKR